MKKFVRMPHPVTGGASGVTGALVNPHSRAILRPMHDLPAWPHRGTKTRRLAFSLLGTAAGVF
jgi:hypothetical protein